MARIVFDSNSFYLDASEDDSIKHCDFIGADLTIRQLLETGPDGPIPNLKFVLDNNCNSSAPKVRFEITGRADIDALRRFCEMALDHYDNDFLEWG